MSAAEWTDPVEIAALEIPAGATILVRLPEEPISAARAQAIHEQASATFPGHRVVILGPGLDMSAHAVNIARCPVHGLHGARATCFECAGPVEQVPMVPAEFLGAPKGESS